MDGPRPPGRLGPTGAALVVLASRLYQGALLEDRYADVGAGGLGR